MTVSLGGNNIEKERGGKYNMAMVTLFLILFNVDVLLLLLFASTARKLSSLTQGPVKIFLKLTASSGY